MVFGRLCKITLLHDKDINSGMIPLKNTCSEETMRGNAVKTLTDSVGNLVNVVIRTISEKACITGIINEAHLAGKLMQIVCDPLAGHRSVKIERPVPCSMV